MLYRIKLFLLYTVVCWSCLMLHQSVKANDSYVDSLAALLSDELHDTIRSNINLDIGDYYFRDRSMNSITYYNRALEIVNDPAVAEHYPDYTYLTTAYIYNVLTTVYSYNTNYVESMRYHNLSLELLESRQDTGRLSTEYHNIALFYYRQADYENAKHFIRQYILFADRANEELDYIGAYSIGLIYRSGGQLDSARLFLNEALKLAEGNANDAGFMKIFGNLALVELDLDHLDEAIALLDRSRTLVDRSGNRIDSIRINSYYSQYYRSVGAYDQALEFANAAVELAEDIDNYGVFLDALQELARVHLAKEDYPNAIAAYDRLLPLKDAFLNEENSKEMGRLEASYEYDKQLLADSISFSNQLEVAAIRLQNSKRQQNLYILLAILSLISAALIGQFFRLRNQRQLVDIQLKESRAKVAEQQLDREQLEKEHLALELKFKEKDIESLLGRNDLKRKLRSQILEEIDQVLDHGEEDTRPELEKLSRSIHHQIMVQEQVEDADHRVQEANAAFEQRLTETFPGLSKGEREICLYLRSDMSNKEIAVHKNISFESVKSTLYRLRKKMHFYKTEELYRALKAL